MTEKELKRLSRADLLELLLMQSRENEELRAKVETLEKKLNDRRIMLEQVGSIAEASLQLNGVFEAAQKACEQYLENVQRLADEELQRSDAFQEEAKKLMEESEQLDGSEQWDDEE